MRTLAGILTIFGGIIGGSILATILHDFGIYGILIYIPLFLAVIGGIMALRKQYYPLALIGAICSVAFPLFGIPAVILLLIKRQDF